MCYRFSLVLAAAVLLLGAVPVPARPTSQSLPEPGWQIFQVHNGTPDLLRVGVYGERYRSSMVAPTASSTLLSSPGDENRQRTLTTRAARLMASCENGVTALTLRPALAVIGPTTSIGPQARSRNADDSFGNSGLLVLMFDDESRIEIDLRDYPRRTDPIYVPEPFDTIQKLLAGEAVYYWEVRRGRRVAFGWDDWAVEPDAVFPIEGLRALLDTTHDPCGWGA